MIEKILTFLVDLLTRYQNRDSLKTFGARRSSEWPRVRREHLRNNPKCAVCGGIKKLEVHHIRPFHIDPSLELDPNNLITLCVGKRSVLCHLIFGHHGNYRKENPDIIEDVKLWNKKLNT